MCGIAGEVRLDGSADAARVARLSLGLRHRGPDATGTYDSPDSRVSFGFRRLSILDLATGDQPIVNEDGSVVSMFNGEIYNHGELRRELMAMGHRFSTDHADGEVITHGYEAWNLSLFERLRGMFAIAVWDARQGRLTLGRDRLGEKPLYYRASGRSIRFASEIGPLEEPTDEIDREALALYLTYQYIPAPATILRGIRKLEAGELAVFDEGGLVRRRYWTAPLRSTENALTDADVHALIEDAVGVRCQADVPIGAFLSGGVDSSVVTALLARTSKEPVHTFSIGFPDPRLDETSAARRVADALGTVHHELRMDQVDSAAIERAVAALGEPLADAAAVPTFLLSEHARQWVKVVLTGEGADELFGGYARYLYQYRLRSLLHAPRPFRALGAMGIRHLVARLDKRFPARLPDLLDAPRSDQPREWRAVMPRSVRHSLLPDVRPPTSDPILAAAGAAGDDVAGSFATDLATWVPEDLLVKVDRATMAFGLEARPPFLDHVLVEAVLALPPERRWAPGRDKHLLRDFAATILPPDTARRPKQTFTTPTDVWLRGPLATSNAAATEALLEWGASRTALASLQARSLGGGRDGGQWAWVMYVLGRWLIAHPAVVERRLAA